MSVYFSVCYSCIYLNRRQELPDVLQCKAFPNGIPNDIFWTTYNEHDKVSTGQQGDYVYTYNGDDFLEPAEISPYRALLYPRLSTKRKRAYWFSCITTLVKGDLSGFIVPSRGHSLATRRLYAYYWDQAYSALLNDQVFCVTGITSQAPDPYIFETLTISQFIDYVNEVRTYYKNQLLQ